MAFGRCSRGTSIGTSEWRAGGSKAPTARADRREQVDRPERRRREGERASDRRDDRARRLRDEHQLAAIEGVGRNAGHHREENDRHDPDEANQPERESLLPGRRQERDVPQTVAVCM